MNIFFPIFLTFRFLGLDSYLVRVTALLKRGACRCGLFDLLGTVAGYQLSVIENSDKLLITLSDRYQIP